VEPFNTGEAPCQRGLAGAGRPKQHKEPPRRDVHVHTVEHLGAAIVLLGAVDCHGKPRGGLGFDEFCGHDVLPRRRHPTGASNRNTPQATATMARAPSTATTSIAVPPAKS